MFSAIVLSALYWSLAKAQGSNTTFFDPGQTDSNGAIRITTRPPFRIFWSCVTVIIACTWVAVHPNVPGIDEGGFKRKWRRISLTLMTLIAPEMILCWAIRQWYGSRMIAKEFKKSKFKKWRKQHAFFLLMGGFIIHEPTGWSVLSFERFMVLVNNGSIQLPDLTEMDVEDRSKGDMISKGLATIQTTWFITQCAARLSQKLPLTELEITTFAFATLNGLMYFFWWNKPLDFQSPIRMEATTINPTLLPGYVVNIGLGALGAGRRQGSQHGFINSMKVSEQIVSSAPVICTPFKIFHDTFRNIMMCATIEPGATRVPTFYAPRGASLNPLAFAIFFVGTIFGVIHCFAWNWSFPTPIEMHLWRASAVIIVLMPFSASLFLWLAAARGEDAFQFSLALALEATIGLPLYMIARLVLLAVAFSAFRNLPPGVEADVLWLSYTAYLIIGS